MNAYILDLNTKVDLCQLIIGQDSKMASILGRLGVIYNVIKCSRGSRKPLITCTINVHAAFSHCNVLSRDHAAEPEVRCLTFFMAEK